MDIQDQAFISIRLHDEREVILIPLTLPTSDIHCFAPNKFHVNLERNKHAYVTTNENLNFSTLPHKNHFHLQPATPYVLRGEALVLDVNAEIWLIEYSKETRLSHKKLQLRTEPFNLEWTTHPEHELLVIALRLEGKGTLALSELELMAHEVRSLRDFPFDFSAPLPPEAAAGEPYPLLPVEGGEESK